MATPPALPVKPGSKPAPATSSVQFKPAREAVATATSKLRVLNKFQDASKHHHF